MTQAAKEKEGLVGEADARGLLDAPAQALALRETQDGQVVAAKPQRASLAVGNRGMELQTFESIWRFAKVVVAAGFAVKGDTVESVVIKVEMGMELGIPAMQAIQNIAVINGRPSIFGDIGKGLVLASGQCEDFIEAPTTPTSPTANLDKWPDDYGWLVTVTRRGKRPASRRFTVRDARVAGLWGKAGPWQNYPNRMLQMRARWWVMGDEFADILCGVMPGETAQDLPPEPSGPEEGKIGGDGKPTRDFAGLTRKNGKGAGKEVGAVVSPDASAAALATGNAPSPAPPPPDEPPIDDLLPPDREPGE